MSARLTRSFESNPLAAPLAPDLQAFVALAVLPLAALWNLVIFRTQSRMFREEGLTIHRASASSIAAPFIRRVRLPSAGVAMSGLL